jgi:hypothetical protein
MKKIGIITSYAVLTIGVTYWLAIAIKHLA